MQATRITTAFSFLICLALTNLQGQAAEKDAALIGINPRAKPKTIEMKVGNDRFKGKTLKGIYRLEGDKLTISFGGPAKDRPTAFVSKPGTEYTVAIHKKLK